MIAPDAKTAAWLIEGLYDFLEARLKERHAMRQEMLTREYGTYLAERYNGPEERLMRSQMVIVDAIRELVRDNTLPVPDDSGEVTWAWAGQDELRHFFSGMTYVVQHLAKVYSDHPDYFEPEGTLDL